GVIAMAAPSTSTSTSNSVDTTVAQQAFGLRDGFTSTKDADLYPLNGTWLQRAIDFAATKANIGNVVTIFDLRSSNKDFDISIKSGLLEAGKSYVLLHFIGANWETEYTDPNAWEVITCQFDGTTLTAHINGTSPFAIAEGTATGAAVVAPKTGEVIAISVILAMLMMAGAVVCAKKARLQK
ncbi:MAG: hypothetical protein J6Z33_11745, partial [Lachnospiraceae bacterium]|nr:hypothetical protein [Lachnospiraceae bacterium]